MGGQLGLDNPLKGISKAVGVNLDPLNLWQEQEKPKMPALETPASSVDSFSRTPTEADPSVALAAAEERRRRQAAAGRSSAILSGGASGTASTQKKTLLG
jgi:hypothetical protein